MRLLFFIIFLFFTPLLYAAEQSVVLVSVAPHKYFVERIAGNTLHIELMVPAGASAHTYEPTPKQILTVSRADIWFQLGEAFENKVGTTLKSYHPKMQFVDMRSSLNLIHDETGCAHCHHNHGADLHIWLSARLAKTQVQTVANALIATYPQHAELYKANLIQFQSELNLLDQEITALLQPVAKRTILVSHPAYAYFCRDYQLDQLSIEFEGKDPTPRQLTNLLQKVRKLEIRRIFTQPQYGNKGALLIAKEIGAEIVSLNPYAEEYMQSMREIAQAFSTM